MVRSIGKSKVFKTVLKVFSFIGVFLFVLVSTLYFTLVVICYGPSKSARNIFITTFLETGQMKFVVKLVANEDLISSVVSANSLGDLSEELDPNLIQVEETDQEDIELVEITGNTFLGKMLIVKDPSRVRLATIYDGSWKQYGITLDKMVSDNNAVAGVNGGLYESTGNAGGRPEGVVVSNGQIQYNHPENTRGVHLVGFDENNILKIIDLSGKSASEAKKIIEDEKIRDAVAFQEEASDANNHFVKLIINGKKRESNGYGSGANPRTAIGQRADGTVLLLVTDGRGASGHIGATASDLIRVMEEYGAVNAANIDGGSSSCMFYNGKYEMTSVTLYYSNTSWRLPTGFIVEGR